MPAAQTSMPHPPRPVDAVITWVDGQDPAHIKLRASHAQKTESELTAEVNAARRWSYAGELEICLLSLARNAPWLRKIFIITNGQIPKGLETLPPKLREKIEIIDHEVIFKDHLEWLPTFNSMAIETMMWRIPNLSERFIYFNDDMFLGGACAPEFFFPDINGEDVKTALFGKWASVPENKIPAFCKSIYRCAKLNAAKATGYDNTRFFSPAHIAMPMRVSALKAMFKARPDLMERNASAKFRGQDQYLVQGLFAHHIYTAGNDGKSRAVISKKPISQNLSASYCKKMPYLGFRINCALIGACPKRFALICVNDLSLLNARFKDKASPAIRKAIGI